MRLIEFNLIELGRRVELVRGESPGPAGLIVAGAGLPRRCVNVTNIANFSTEVKRKTGHVSRENMTGKCVAEIADWRQVLGFLHGSLLVPRSARWHWSVRDSEISGKDLTNDGGSFHAARIGFRDHCVVQVCGEGDVDFRRVRGHV